MFLFQEISTGSTSLIKYIINKIYHFLTSDDITKSNGTVTS